MDYSIVIPVFNKAELTRQCLATLRPTLEGAGEGEVIVVDNASTDETPEMLAEFPWIRLIRNERNLGFAGANNQAARVAKGTYLVLLNNDTKALPGWLAAMLQVAAEPGVGAVGARLLFADDTIQHAGVVVAPVPFGRVGLAPYHYAWKSPANAPNVSERREYQIVTGACLATPRDLYERLGGLDEIYWNGYEDVDYCLKVRREGLKVIYEPRATLYHYESQSGVQRFRKVPWNVRILSERWSDAVAFDSSARYVENGDFPVLLRDENAGVMKSLIRTPPAAVIAHGDLDASAAPGFEASLRMCRTPISVVEFCSEAEAIERARAAMQVRGERLLVLVDARCTLAAGWLDEMAAQVVTAFNVAAVTSAPELPFGENVVTLASDARCTLLWLKQLPQHLELRQFDTIGGAVADLLLRAVEYERGTRGVSRSIGTVPPLVEDASFAADRGRPLASVFDTDPASIERIFRARAADAPPLVSIVMLSWNAPAFTKMALQSIAKCTREPYEVIIVDNGSGPETLEMLRAVDDSHVRICFNPSNRGFAGGNNDGIVASRGEYVVFLNNDVIVTEGWLDGLVAPFARFPGVGVTAPRSNKVVGHQQVFDARYDSEAELIAFAQRRRELNQERGYFTDRAIGLCLCVTKRVLDTIGGFDERFALGNFEDDDFCIRVRAAGYAIFVCDDAFIHHFGSASFTANHVDYAATMHQNWTRFAEKWGYSTEFPVNGYQPRVAIAKGFDRLAHFAPLPFAEDEDVLPWGVHTIFCAEVREERDWAKTAEFVKRFARSFTIDDGAMLAIGAFGAETAQTLAERVERIFARAGVDPQRSGYVEVSDEDRIEVWRARFDNARTIDVPTLSDRSPSALRRLVRESS